ncbi:MAG: hypothetical protein JJ979_02655 [Roseibium sp.]|nr:hypothetical protein [Roseibium sp.]
MSDDQQPALIESDKYSHLTEAALVELAYQVVAAGLEEGRFELNDAVEPRSGQILGDFEITVKRTSDFAFVEDDDPDSNVVPVSDFKRV